MTYNVVFDVAEQGYASWAFPAFGLIFIVLGALYAFAPPAVLQSLSPRSPGPRSPWMHRVLGWCFLLFASAWTVTAASATYEDYHNAASALHDGRYEVVEGEVTDFFSGSKRESFSVQGQRFSYSDYIVIAGFHKTTRKGGPIREGLNVRIAYLPASQNMILRLEIAEPR